MIRYTIIDNLSLILYVEKKYFDSSYILNFASEIFKDFSIQTEDTNDYTSIYLSSKTGVINEEIVERISQSLIDHQVRFNLLKENGHIRDMIVEQAFSSTRK